MATRLRAIVFTLTVFFLAASLPNTASIAVAADLDAKGEADAKEATRLYREGRYDEAAKLFARLASDYPDLTIFERNLGACFYYLRKPEPAVSNLRGYLNHRKDIAPDDRATVERWIDEMEALRLQNAAASAATPSTAPQREATGPVPEPSAEATPAAVTPAGLDVSGNTAASQDAAEHRPIYKTWWLWTGVGAVVVAGVVTAVLLSGGSDDLCAGSANRCEVVK